MLYGCRNVTEEIHKIIQEKDVGLLVAHNAHCVGLQIPGDTKKLTTRRDDNHAMVVSKLNWANIFQMKQHLFVCKSDTRYMPLLSKHIDKHTHRHMKCISVSTNKQISAFRTMWLYIFWTENIFSPFLCSILLMMTICYGIYCLHILSKMTKHLKPNYIST